MWRTQRPSAIDIICLAAGASLLVLVPIVFFAPWLIEPVIRPLVGAVPTPMMWLLFAAAVPLGLSLLMVPLLRRLQHKPARQSALLALLLVCGIWMMILGPPSILSASVIGTVAGTLIGLAILLLLAPRRRHHDTAGGFPISIRNS